MRGCAIMTRMDRNIFSNSDERKLAALGVGVVYAYGSRVRGTDREDSDYDVGVVFVDPRGAAYDLKTYGELYDILSSVFPDTLHGAKLDIAFLQRANAKLQLDAINFGTVVFESNPRIRANFEESVVRAYDDYRFLQKEYENANLAAFRA